MLIHFFFRKSSQNADDSCPNKAKKRRFQFLPKDEFPSEDLYNKYVEQVQDLRKENKVLKQKVRRRSKKISSLKDMAEHLRSSYISNSAADYLEVFYN